MLPNLFHITCFRVELRLSQIAKRTDAASPMSATGRAIISLGERAKVLMRIDRLRMESDISIDSKVFGG